MPVTTTQNSVFQTEEKEKVKIKRNHDSAGFSDMFYAQKTKKGSNHNSPKQKNKDLKDLE